MGNVAPAKTYELPPQCTPSEVTVSNHNSSDWQSSINSMKGRYQFVLHKKLFTDVCFIVGEEQKQHLYANKLILSIGSSVFETMFSDRWSSGNSEIEVPDITPAAFRELLRFIYCEDVRLTMGIVWSVLYAAKKYAIESLRARCFYFLRRAIDSDNVLSILMNARFYDEDSMMQLCLEFIDNHSSCINSGGFSNIDLGTLCLILKRNTLKISEISLFRAVLRWTHAECARQKLPLNPENKQSVSREASNLVRFPLMSFKDFVDEVPDSGLLTPKEQMSVVSYFNKKPRPSTKYSTTPRDFQIDSPKLSQRAKIVIKDTLKGTHSLNIYPPYDTIEDIILLLQDRTGIYQSQQSLRFKDNVLQPHCLADMYGIKEGSVLSLQVGGGEFTQLQFKKSDGKIRFFVLFMLNGLNIALNVKQSETIRKVKMMIENREGLPSSQQRLIFNERRLNDNYTVQDYGIKNGSTVYLINRMQGAGLSPDTSKPTNQLPG